MSEDFTNVLVRMSVELKANLQREAFVHHRKLTQEINMRLEASLASDSSAQPPPPPAPAPYTQPNTPTVAHTNDHGPAGALADTDRAMLEIFRKMPVEKQLALLSLFR